MDRVATVIVLLLVVLASASDGRTDEERDIFVEGAPDAIVSCDRDDCWVASASLAPVRVRRPSEGVIELPDTPTSRYLVLTDSGDAASHGTIHWLVDDLPEELRRLPWRARDGHLNLTGPPGAKAEVLVGGFAPSVIRLEPTNRRESIVLQPVRSVTITTRPASGGELLLAANKDVHLASLFLMAARRWEIPETGELVLQDLPANQAMFGVLFSPGWAPLVGPLPIGATHITLSLSDGLGVTGTVRDNEGRPVSDADVWGTGSVSTLDGWRYTQRSKTDEDGYFLLAGFIDGTIEISVWKDGFTKAIQTVELDSIAAQPLTFEIAPGTDLEVVVRDTNDNPLPGIRVQLEEETERTDKSGHAVFKGRTIGEEIELTLDGDIITPRNIPVVANGEIVRLIVTRAGGIEWPLILTHEVAEEEVLVDLAKWNAEGREIAGGSGTWDSDSETAKAVGLEPGTYVMSVRLPGFERIRSEPVEVSLDEVITLTAASPTAGLSVEGRVIDSKTGESIAGALIEVEEGSPRVARDPSEVLAPRTRRTDADGRFRVGGLSETEHRIRIRAPGKAPSVVADVIPAKGANDLGDIELGDGLTVEGHVLDRSGRALAGASVVIREPYPYAYFPEAEATTDAAGFFRFELLATGEWKVEAVEGAARASERVEGREDETVEVELVVGGVELELVVLRGDLPASEGRLTLTSKGAEPPGIVVQINRGEQTREFFGVPGDRFEGWVNMEGTAVLNGVKPGRYNLGYRSSDGRFSGTAELVVPDVPRHNAIVRLPSGSVEGFVVDPDERPVSGAGVRCLTPSGGTPAIAYSDGAGAFRIDGLPSGPAQVTARHDSFVESEPLDVEIVEDVPVGPVVLRLGSLQESGLKVRIVAASAGLSGAPVAVDGPESRLEFTDSAGVATFAGLPRGAYRVCARIFGGPAGCVDGIVEVGDRGLVETELTLGQGGWVEVLSSADLSDSRYQVVTSAGADVTRVLFLGNPPYADGERAVIGPIVAGRYQVTCLNCDGAASGSVDVSAGETAVLDLR